MNNSLKNWGTDAWANIFALRWLSLYNDSMFTHDRHLCLSGQEAQRLYSHCLFGSVFELVHAIRVCKLRSGLHEWRKRVSRGLLGGYVFFFALIAPFICWGAAGDPTHPHANAHFVFAEPLGAHSEPVGIAVNELPSVAPHAHGPGLHRPHTHVRPTYLLQSTTRTDTVAGQAVPATILAQLLIVVAWGAIVIRKPMPQMAERMASPLPMFLPLSVPTPPPRHLSAVVLIF